MNYNRIYTQIIEKARSRKLSKDVYVEEHHIVPCCMFIGGRDNQEAWSNKNLVYLTPREHYVCHQLLVKMYPKFRPLIQSIRAMSMTKDSTPCRNNRMYGWLREKWVDSQKVKRVELSCNVCGDSYEVRPIESKRSRYCSRKCANEGQRKQITCKCKECGESYDVAENRVSRTKYCSMVCYSVARKRAPRRSKYQNKCERCGSMFNVPACRKDRARYCSFECSKGKRGPQKNPRS